MAKPLSREAPKSPGQQPAGTGGEPPGAVAAKQELSILEQLSSMVWATISSLSRRPKFDSETGELELALHDLNQSQLKGYEELAHHCYGRTVIGQETDDSDKAIGHFAYRITQANVGAPDCAILARNSPLASGLVTARPGSEAEVTVPRGARYFKISEVRTFDGPSSLLSPSHEPNFRSMLIQEIGVKTPITIQNLRAFVRRIASPHPPSEVPEQEVKFDIFGDPTWFENWAGVSLGDSDTQSLSHQFFTRTTPDQERALNNPRGVTLVEGVAGAGKTSGSS